MHNSHSAVIHPTLPLILPTNEEHRKWDNAFELLMVFQGLFVSGTDPAKYYTQIVG